MREFLVLGPLEVRRDGVHVELGPPKQRAVLLALLLARGGVVGADRLIGAVWGDEPPAAATTSVQAYISNLRRALRHSGEPSPIGRIGGGYRLDLGADRVDLIEFGRQVQAARTARDDHRWEVALDESAAALAWWRGDVETSVDRESSWMAAEVAALAELRVAVAETHTTALLAVGDIGGALSEIVALRARDPLRDRGVWLHMVALYRAGRPTEALEVYADHQRTLARELGLDPGAELVELHGAILHHDPVIAAWPRPPHWSGAPRAPVPVGEQQTAPPPRAPSNTEHPAAPAGSALVGRDTELARLRKTLVEPHGGTRWVVLDGPPGIGKTRLAEEVSGWARDRGERVVWVRCPEADGIPAWWPMRQLCRALDVDPDTVLAVPAGVDADTARFSVYEHLQTVLEQAAQPTPLTVVVDDIQWADAMSAGLLHYLTTALHEPSIAIVTTVREGEGGAEVERFRTAVTRVDGLHIDVPQLTRDEVTQLVSAVADEPPAPDDIDTLTRRTGGNPLFVSEFARLPPMERRRDLIPARVRSVLGRRLSALDPTVLEILGHAAVLGDEIDVAMLAAVTGRDLDELADCLDEAIDDHILVVESDGGRARFAHALLRDEALAAIRPLRRCRIHQRCAAILDGVDGPAGTARRAMHLLAALPVADARETIEACRIAANAATALWDSENAAFFLQAALTTRESSDLDAVERADTDDLLIELLAARARSGQVQMVLDTVETRLYEAIRMGNASTVGRLASALIRSGGAWPWIGPHIDNSSLQAALADAEYFVADDPPNLARVLAAAAIGQCYHRDGAVPAGLLDRAGQLAADLDDAIVADVTLARLITYSGVAQRAPEASGLAAGLAALDYPDRDVDSVILDAVLTMSTMALGDVAATERHVRRGIAGSERLRLPILRAQLRWMEASVAVWHGEFDRAKDHFRTAVAVHEQTELYVAGSGAIAMMAMATERGLLDEFVDTGGLDPVTWARTVSAQFADNHVVILLAAGVAKIAGADGDLDLAHSMVTAWLDDSRAMIWTSLAQAVLLAHVVADLGTTELEFVEYAEPLIDYLMPYREYIATVGQVGCVGPVALALAELHYLLGDEAVGDEMLHLARQMSVAGGGLPSELRCRLLAAERQAPTAMTAAEIAEVEFRARSLGLAQLADTAGAMLVQH